MADKYVAYVSCYTRGSRDGIKIYDVDMKNGKTWASSSAMVSDIDSRKLSSSGLFGLVDTTKDTLWVGLPTGNQLEVKFDN